MVTIPLSELETLAVGLFGLVVATAIARRVPLLARLSVPTAVIRSCAIKPIGANSMKARSSGWAPMRWFS